MLNSITAREKPKSGNKLQIKKYELSEGKRHDMKTEGKRMTTVNLGEHGQGIR